MNPEDGPDGRDGSPGEDRSPDTDPDEGALAERLDELEASLDELRAELRAEAGRGPLGTPTPARPPRLSELLRFTERYTIPTLIAVLETTIKSLELLQGTLRLADPNRRFGADDAVDAAGDVTGAAHAGSAAAGDRLTGVRAEAERGLARSLRELQRALDGADLPENAASRSIIEDARELSAEIESRISEGRTKSARSQDSSGQDIREDRSDRSEDDVVHIDVTSPDEGTAGDPDRDSDGADDEVADGEPATEERTDNDRNRYERSRDEQTGDSPTVDVDSELESIRREVNGERTGDDTDSGRNTADRDKEVEDQDQEVEDQDEEVEDQDEEVEDQDEDSGGSDDRGDDASHDA